MAMLIISASGTPAPAYENETFGAVEEPEVVSTERPFGFNNLGHTCDQGAVLQMPIPLRCEDGLDMSKYCGAPTHTCGALDQMVVQARMTRESVSSMPSHLSCIVGPDGPELASIRSRIHNKNTINAVHLCVCGFVCSYVCVRACSPAFSLLVVPCYQLLTS
ncbi:hypothetical protein Vretimale_16793, partial [Volvox reticuliferus]